jgi:hypothetical protein
MRHPPLGLLNMIASELRDAGRRLYGPRWRKPLAEILRVDAATLRRWASGKINVPGPVALAIQLLSERAPKPQS